MKKLTELRPCDNCGGSITPVFYKVEIQTSGIDLQATRRNLGLAAFFGGGGAGLALASAMGDGDEVVKHVGEPVQLVLCTNCYCGISAEPCNLAVLADQRAQRTDHATSEEKTA